MIYIREQADGSLALHTKGRNGHSYQYHGYDIIAAVYEFANAHNIRGVPEWTLLPKYPKPRRLPRNG